MTKVFVEQPLALPGSDDNIFYKTREALKPRSWPGFDSGIVHAFEVFNS